MKTHTQTPRRRVILVNRIEDQLPARAAHAVYLSRAASRRRALDSYLALRRWAEARRRHLLAEHAELQETDGEDPDFEQLGASHDDADPGEDLPDDSWTKGRIYERAQELDIDGRSKMNKAELLDAVREALMESQSSADAGTDAEEQTPATATA